MKTKLLLLLSILLCTTNVYAKTIYTGYTFNGYVDEIKEDDELYRYESIKLNKFYKMDRIDEVYAPIGNVFDTSPKIDESDYIYTSLYTTTPSSKSYETVVMNMNDTDATNTIKLRGFVLNGNNINELEIYNKDEKINYTINGASFLKDGITNDGQNYEDGYITITFHQTPINDLHLKLYYSDINNKPISFKIQIMNMKGVGTFKSITLSPKNKEVISTIIKPYTADYYQKYMIDHDIEATEDITNVYEDKIKLYKHYDEGKVLCALTELDDIEGCTYDENESKIVYREYKREILEIVDDEQQDDKDKKLEEDKPKEEFNEEVKEEEKLEVEPKKEEIKDEETKENNKEKAVDIEEEKLENATTEYEKEKMIEEEKIVDNPQSDIFENSIPSIETTKTKETTNMYSVPSKKSYKNEPSKEETLDIVSNDDEEKEIMTTSTTMRIEQEKKEVHSQTPYLIASCIGFTLFLALINLIKFLKTKFI